MANQTYLATKTGRVADLISVLVLIVVGTIAYGNSFDVPFVFDDLRNITENSYVQVTQLDSRQLMNVATRSPSRRRPLSNISFALNYYVGGFNVWGYHFVNLCIHLFCGVLVYLLGLVTFERLPPQDHGPPETARSSSIPWVALAAALIFISHPIQTQAVTYVVQRMASLATLFYLAALLGFIYGRTAVTGWGRWSWWFGSSISWLVALGCKEIAATLPFAIMLYEWYFFQNLDRGWLKRCSIYLGSVFALVAIVVVASRGSNLLEWLDDRYSHREFTLGERLLTQFRVVLHYLSLVVWPLPSRFFLTHDIAISHSLFKPISTLFSLLAVSGLLAVAVLTTRRYRIVSFSILWCFLHLAIESTVIPLELVYEHRMYLPMVGISLMIAWGLFRRVPVGRGSVIAAVVLVLSLTVATHFRNSYWRNPSALWADIVAKYPEDARAHSNLGYTLVAQGQLAEGIEHYNRALELTPGILKTRNNLGEALVQQGKVAEAVKHFRWAVKIDPSLYMAHLNLGLIRASQGELDEAVQHYQRAIEAKPDYAEVHYNLALALTSQGNRPEAAEHYRLALKYKPLFADAHYNLGVLHASAGNVSNAIQQYRLATQVDPEYAPAHYNLGNALFKQGKPEDAIEHYRRALAIDPNLPQVHKNLATILAMRGQVAEAIEHYRQAISIDPDQADVHFNLALCLVSQKNRSEADEHFQTALNLAISQGDESMADAIRKRMRSP